MKQPSTWEIYKELVICLFTKTTPGSLPTNRQMITIIADETSNFFEIFYLGIEILSCSQKHYSIFILIYLTIQKEKSNFT